MKKNHEIPKKPTFSDGFVWDDPRQRSHFAVTRLSSALNWPLTELTRATEARREGTSAGNPMGNPLEIHGKTEIFHGKSTQHHPRNGGFPWESHLEMIPENGGFWENLSRNMEK